VAHPGKILRNAEDGVTAGFELVLTPALFGLFGWMIDSWLGTAPVFMFVLAGIVAAYEIWKLWYGYTQRMQALEAQLPDTRGTRG